MTGLATSQGQPGTLLLFAWIAGLSAVESVSFTWPGGRRYISAARVHQRGVSAGVTSLRTAASSWRPSLNKPCHDKEDT